MRGYTISQGEEYLVKHKYTLEAEIEIVEGTEELKKAVASIVQFPAHKTPDMLFFSGIFVSSGANLNKAFFLPSELVKANHTIVNKALDIEHSEDQIVGHIYSSAFVDRDGKKLDTEELKAMDQAALDKLDLDVMIGGILYKSRFPELAKEVKGDKWKLSMETYFTNYDVKIGDLILSKKEAEALGIATDSVLGKLARILKRGKEVAKGNITRVLRELMFSGCGLVKNPANPRSVILETANKNRNLEEGEITIELDPDYRESEMKDKEHSQVTSPADDQGSPDDGYNVRRQTSPGICVSYKKRVIDATYEGPDAKVLHEDWCTLYERGCTSPSRGADHPKCLRRTIKDQARTYANRKFTQLQDEDKRGGLLSKLQDLLNRI
jgi:hypothetical protein